MMSFFAGREENVDRAALVLRLVLAAGFIGHGYQKVFGMGLSNMGGMFAHMGVPLPGLAGPLIALLELTAGFAFLFGIFARVFGFLIACDMLGAMIFVHATGGFFAPKGVELVLGNFAMATAVFFLGAGAYSVDALLAQRGAPAP
ncbi:MAG: DoxX family protein [Gemmatimonadaceae bacterium]|nr:DoxX family protein [Gemmatimonadaceae bacterium]